MSVTDSDLMRFAEETLRDVVSEASHRASVSRAYYSAYHALSPFASALPKSAACPKTLGDRLSHSELVERLREWKTDGVSPNLSRMTATKSSLWRHVQAAANARVLADYRISRELTLAEAQTQIERAKRILRAAQQIETEKARSGDADWATGTVAE